MTWSYCQELCFFNFYFFFSLLDPVDEACWIGSLIWAIEGLIALKSVAIARWLECSSEMAIEFGLSTGEIFIHPPQGTTFV